ncbi:uncharacterized protein A4U43_C08F30240 [Asparagus officinalis]|nr:uncharacterized protein A4U43_C08F30240 [Asparagus officinalis]
MERIWTEYHKLLGEVTILRAGGGVDLRQTVEVSDPSSPKVDRLRRELEVSQRKAERMEEALREKDDAEETAKAEKEVAVYMSWLASGEAVPLLELHRYRTVASWLRLPDGEVAASG